MPRRQRLNPAGTAAAPSLPSTMWSQPSHIRSKWPPASGQRLQLPRLVSCPHQPCSADGAAIRRGRRQSAQALALGAVHQQASGPRSCGRKPARGRPGHLPVRQLRASPLCDTPDSPIRARKCSFAGLGVAPPPGPPQLRPLLVAAASVTWATHCNQLFSACTPPCTHPPSVHALPARALCRFPHDHEPQTAACTRGRPIACGGSGPRTIAAQRETAASSPINTTDGDSPAWRGTSELSPAQTPLPRTWMSLCRPPEPDPRFNPSVPQPARTIAPGWVVKITTPPTV